MDISINGDKVAVSEDASLLAVLEDRCFANKPGVAVALNNVVIPKTQWAKKTLQTKDKVLIIAATKGG